MLAAVLNALMPVIHFLSVTAVGFVLSGLAVWAVRDRVIDPASKPRPSRGGWRGAWDALLDGARLMLSEPTTGALLLVNAFANGPWSVALQLAIALMVVEHDPHLFGLHGLAALGLIIGAIGVGDVVGNLVAGSVRFARPLSTMFLGYVAMGLGFVLLALAAWGLPNPYKLPGMMLSGVVSGLGGPFFFIPMITRMQTTFRGAEIARVFRLRLAIMAGSMLVFNLGATPLFDLIGPTHTEFYLGLMLLGLGVVGHLYYRRRENEPERVPTMPIRRRSRSRHLDVLWGSPSHGIGELHGQETWRPRPGGIRFLQRNLRGWLATLESSGSRRGPGRRRWWCAGCHRRAGPDRSSEVRHPSPRHQDHQQSRLNQRSCGRVGRRIDAHGSANYPLAGNTVY